MNPVARHLALLGLAGFALLTPSSGFAEGAILLNSVPGGIVFPSFQEATVLNPATLRNENAIAAQVEFAPEWNGSTGGAQGSIAWGNSKFGLGAAILGSSRASYHYDETTGLVTHSSWGLSQAVVGASIGAGSASAGVNFAFPISNFSWSSTDLAIRLGKGSKLTSAFILRHADAIPTGATLEAGVGYAEPEMFAVEGHVETPSFSNLATGSFEVGGDIILNIKKFGLGFGVDTWLGTTGTSGGFASEIRATYWLGKTWQALLRLDSNFAPSFGLTWARGGK
jgi:hypothetical protein